MADGVRTAERTPRALQEAHRLAAGVIREHSRTFHFATAFLPAKKRLAVRSLYGFCRATDDLVDRGNATVAEIERWRAQVALPAQRQTEPVLISWAATREEFEVDRRYERELIDGVRMDAAPRRYRTWAELERYCYLVASTVGLLSIPIIGLAPGAKPETAAAFAVQLGVALQLTNILRDVGEDAARDRIYLPGEDLAAFGVSEGDIRRGVCDGRFAALMRFEIRRARDLYRAALPGIALLERSVRLAVGAAALLYRAILDEIEALRYDVFTRRAHLPAWKKLVRLPGILWKVHSLRTPQEWSGE
jgi:phytoene synthase